jgi:hypothetical protein
MRRHRVAGVIVVIAATALAAGAFAATDLSGTWMFSVDVGDTHGEPTFVFKQQGEKLTGTVTRGRGEQRVTGTVKGDKAVFGFEGGRGGQPLKATYSGTIESATKMRGTVEFSGALVGRGEWVATKRP